MPPCPLLPYMLSPRAPCQRAQPCRLTASSPKPSRARLAAPQPGAALAWLSAPVPRAGRGCCAGGTAAAEHFCGSKRTAALQEVTSRQVARSAVAQSVSATGSSRDCSTAPRDEELLRRRLEPGSDRLWRFGSGASHEAPPGSRATLSHPESEAQSSTSSGSPAGGRHRGELRKQVATIFGS